MLANRTIKNLKKIHSRISADGGQVKFYKGSDRKALQALLRDHGFHSTEGRLELLGLLKAVKKPMSVPSIVAGLPGRLDEVNIYRALEALTQARVLSRSDLRRGGAHYELAHGHHHHVICNNCGVTEDVDECSDKNLEKRVLQNSKKFSTINTHALEFFGTCNSCTQT